MKTIGFNTGEQFIFAVLQGRKRIDYKKLAKAVGCKRKSLKMLSSDIVETELGYQIGGLSPLHIDERVTVYFDSEIAALGSVFCGIGVRNKTLKILSSDLISVTKGIVVDLVE